MGFNFRNLIRTEARIRAAVTGSALPIEPPRRDAFKPDPVDRAASPPTPRVRHGV